MSDAMIRLEHVSKSFPGAEAPAVGDLGFEVPRGTIVTLVGPSGCGKTTTLKMINRIIEPSSGTIWVDGVEATATEPHELRRSIGYVIQQIGLFPHRTISQNIGTVPELLGWEDRRIEERINELIDLVGLDRELLARYPSELSGGQQQRVGVARALAADPPVLLMDEPFGAVDPIVRTRLQEELLILQDKVRKTIVFVTHDIDEAIRLGDQICILNVGGVLEQIGPPEAVLSDPANAFVDDFIGGERGLKRLGLMPVGDAALERGPMVGPTASDDEARAAMRRYETTWVGVLDGERLVGWVSEQDLEGHTSLEGLEVKPIERSVAPSDSLRAALDLVVRSHERVAIVVDEGRYLGTLGLESISREITE
jgi:osmoprotectant transport system ATP-binding protein